MKYLTICFLLFCVYQTNAQSPTKDSIKIIYEKDNMKPQPAVFINGMFGGSLLSGIKPESIESLTIEKTDTMFQGIKYQGKLYVKLKHQIIPICLKQLLTKYTNLKDEPVLFMFDNNLIKASDYNTYLVDESNIIEIKIDDFTIPNQKNQLKIVKILTKKEENIKKLNEIRIRGTEVAIR